MSVVADGIAANSERIRTWRADYALVEKVLVEDPSFYTGDENGRKAGLPEAQQTIDGRFLESQNVEGRFVVDLFSDRLFTSYGIVGDVHYKEAGGGEREFHGEITASESFRHDALLTASEYVYLLHHSRFSGVTGFPEVVEPLNGYRVVHRASAETGRQLTRQSTVFDPRRLLETGGRSVHERVALAAEGISKGIADGSVTATLSDPGDGQFELTYRRGMGDVSAATFRYCGDVLVASEYSVAIEHRGKFTDRYEYEIVDGIAIPVVYEYQQVDENGELRRGRTVSLSNVTINGPVSDAEFDVAVLEPASLDRMVDHRQGDDVSIFVDTTTVVPAGEFKVSMLPNGVEFVDRSKPVMGRGESIPALNDRSSADGPSGFSLRTWVVGGNVVLLLVVAAITCWRSTR